MHISAHQLDLKLITLFRISHECGISLNITAQIHLIQAAFLSSEECSIWVDSSRERGYFHMEIANHQ